MKSSRIETLSVDYHKVQALKVKLLRQLILNFTHCFPAIPIKIIDTFNVKLSTNDLDEFKKHFRKVTPKVNLDDSTFTAKIPFDYLQKFKRCFPSVKLNIKDSFDVSLSHNEFIIYQKLFPKTISAKIKHHEESHDINLPIDALMIFRKCLPTHLIDELEYSGLEAPSALTRFRTSFSQVTSSLFSSKRTPSDDDLDQSSYNNTADDEPIDCEITTSLMIKSLIFLYLDQSSPSFITTCKEADFEKLTEGQVISILEFNQQCATSKQITMLLKKLGQQNTACVIRAGDKSQPSPVRELLSANEEHLSLLKATFEEKQREAQEKANKKTKEEAELKAKNEVLEAKALQEVTRLKAEAAEEEAKIEAQAMAQLEQAAKEIAKEMAEEEAAAKAQRKTVEKNLRRLNANKAVIKPKESKEDIRTHDKANPGKSMLMSRSTGSLKPHKKAEIIASERPIFVTSQHRLHHMKKSLIGNPPPPAEKNTNERLRGIFFPNTKEDTKRMQRVVSTQSIRRPR